MILFCAFLDLSIPFGKKLKGKFGDKSEFAYLCTQTNIDYSQKISILL